VEDRGAQAADIDLMRVLIVGCGYVGLPVGARLVSTGHEVVGIRRDSTAGDELARNGIRLIQADITRPDDLRRIEPNFDTVINLVSSTKGGPEEYRRVYLEGTRNLLQWLAPNPPKHYLYTSSTSVYAQEDGSWVTEQSPAVPNSTTSRILVDTETELLRRFPAIILRVGGIYGPERGHLFRQYLRGEAVMREDGSAYINGIHLEDVAGALCHLISHGQPGEIYNTVDNEPVTQRQFFEWLSATLKKPMPPSAPADPNRKRGLTNKRVSNAKLRSTGYEFKFPTFREGYTAEIQRLAGDL
jgi:nucleoside-diphosphate-sugar epimerase